jgi:hypothetical protein
MQPGPSPAPTDPSLRTTVTFGDLAEAIRGYLERNGCSAIAADSGWATAWLEACGYPGLVMLFEALAETPPEARKPGIKIDTLGVDLANVSCLFYAQRLAALAHNRGRLFLRNVRHGLFLVPFAVKADMAIGCPVDPSFALGGGRTKNPYAEKLEAAEKNGVSVDLESFAKLNPS